MRTGVSLTPLSALRTRFLLLGFLVQIQYEGLCCVFLSLGFPCLVFVSWRPVLSEK